MRFFKKDGYVKFRKTNDANQIDEWKSNGWVEVDKNGFSVSNSSSKSKSKKK